MSEMNNNTLVTPPSQDFDTLSYRGSMQQILQENLGSYVIIEFLIGTGNLESRQGILYNVGSQFVVLYDDINLRYVVCDIFSIKFVTFLLPGYRPGQVPSAMVAAEEAEIQEESAPSETSRPQPGATQSTEDTDAMPAAAPVAAPRLSRVTPSQAAYSYAVRRRPVS